MGSETKDFAFGALNTHPEFDRTVLMVRTMRPDDPEGRAFLQREVAGDPEVRRFMSLRGMTFARSSKVEVIPGPERRTLHDIDCAESPIFRWLGAIPRAVADGWLGEPSTPQEKARCAPGMQPLPKKSEVLLVENFALFALPLGCREAQQVVLRAVEDPQQREAVYVARVDHWALAADTALPKEFESAVSAYEAHMKAGVHLGGLTVLMVPPYDPLRDA